MRAGEDEIPADSEAVEKTTFVDELSSLINTHNLECPSNTPDFIIAQFLGSCLEAFHSAVCHRTEWKGDDPVTGP